MDEIFKSIDTPEYREKRARGQFAPKFSDSDEEEEPEEDHSNIETDDLENLFGAPKELTKLNQDFEWMQDELSDLEDIDSLLSEAKTLTGKKNQDELEKDTEETLEAEEEPSDFEEAGTGDNLDSFSLEPLDSETPEETLSVFEPNQKYDTLNSAQNEENGSMEEINFLDQEEMEAESLEETPGMGGIDDFEMTSQEESGQESFQTW